MNDHEWVPAKGYSGRNITAFAGYSKIYKTKNGINVFENSTMGDASVLASAGNIKSNGIGACRGRRAGQIFKLSCKKETTTPTQKTKERSPLPLLFHECRLCVIAGNISPIDVITHVPILCEESDIPYIYVASKEDLANAGATKRPTCCVLVLTKPTKGELGQEEQDKLKADYTLVVEDVKELASSLF
ncbi:hypothetical protein CUMW_280560 [Citrus unshiu]|uniref:Ribosomal protein eL8/eL30/eS12/Gadd45 domain-containing protein n=2 Tax=Citrus TaxID=2706 RepID=A0A2H5MUS4_CITUN|nr:hypothetical protein CUMW_280560 [Citrus unshiu]